jgi:hypothetical protein
MQIFRAMLHDETIYPDPFTFNPDRFMKDGQLNPDVRDPGHATFGFGRRYASLAYYLQISRLISFLLQGCALVATWRFRRFGLLWPP